MQQNQLTVTNTTIMEDINNLRKNKAGMRSVNDFMDIAVKYGVDVKGKRVDNYSRLDGTEDFLNSLCKRDGKPQNAESRFEYLAAKKGGSGPERGTWAHDDVLINIAQWLDSDFEVLVQDIFKSVVTNVPMHTIQHNIATYKVSYQDAINLAPAIFAMLKLVPEMSDMDAAIGANDMVEKQCGVNVFKETGNVHILANHQKSQFKTPTYLGALIGVSAYRFNELLLEKDLQQWDESQLKWVATAKGKQYSEPVNGWYGTGLKDPFLRWTTSVLPLVTPKLPSNLFGM